MGRVLLVATALCAVTVFCGCEGGGAPETPTTQEPAAPVFVRVTVNQPGGAAVDIEQAVTVKIEAAVMAMADVGEVRSVSREGVSEVDVEFAPGVAMAEAVAAVRRAVESRAPDLPVDSEQPIVELEVGPLSAGIAIYGEASYVFLHKLADEFRGRLASVTGVGRAELIGEGAEMEIRIELPPELLRKYDLTLDSVQKAIRSSGQGGGEALAQVVVGHSGGAEIRLADIADIREGNYSETIVDVDGKGGAWVHVYAHQRQDPSAVAKAVRAAAAGYRPQLPNGVRMGVYDCSAAGRAPLVRVTAVCPHLPAEAVRRHLTSTLASILKMIEGVASVSTVSSRDRSEALVAFERGTVLREAVDRTREELTRERDHIGAPPGGLTVEPVPPVPIGRFDVFGGASADNRLTKAMRLRTTLRAVEGIARVDAPDLEPGRPALELVMKRQAMAAYGLTEKALTAAIWSSFYGYGDVIKSGSRRLRIVGPRPPAGGPGLDRLMIRVKDGRHVPLSELADVKRARQRPAISRVDGRRCITLEIFANDPREAASIVEKASSLAAAATDKSAGSERIEVRFRSRAQPRLPVPPVAGTRPGR